MSEEWNAKVQWVDGFKMIATDFRKHSIVLDIPEKVGGENTGIAPGRLLLISIAGCSAVDIVLLLKKFRQQLTGLEVFVKGEQRKEEYPYYFKKILLKYVVKGKNLDEEQVKRAIRLSIEKYCSVRATIGDKTEVNTCYEIIEE